MRASINLSLTSTSVISRALVALPPGESLVHLGEAGALVERACSDSSAKLGFESRALLYNVAVSLMQLENMSQDAIIAAMMYHLPVLSERVKADSIKRVLGRGE